MAAAAQAAAIAGNPLMDGHLFNVLGIDHQPLRAKLILAGFTDEIDALTTKQDAFATKACSGVRKGGGLSAAMLSIEMEEDLVNMVRWSRYTYQTNRPIAWVEATIANT